MAPYTRKTVLITKNCNNLQHMTTFYGVTQAIIVSDKAYKEQNSTSFFTLVFTLLEEIH